MAVVCPACGTQNSDKAKFCAECATPLALVPRPRESRRMVTILFADVSGSTSLGEQLDPESLRALMGRYFAEMATIIERHGGTVEKFIGDAVMAVFGIPQLHEDDALRAVRAAAEIGERLGHLNAELEAERGMAIRFRTGVNSGEVVAGDPMSGQSLVIGDAVNIAARLEQVATPGEIIIGPLTYQLARDAVTAEPLEPLALKGKGQLVQAYRLVSVMPGAAGHSRRLDAPLVGREGELARLQEAFASAVAERRCGLVTLLGAAGVGKTRLLGEFLASVRERAGVLAGRCLPYGEGITYWPVAEAIRAAARIDENDDREAALAKLQGLAADVPEATLVADRIGQAMGLAGGSAPQEEIFWALRKLLETLAREHPLVIEFDDIQWADDTFLDLLEHLLTLSHDAPLLIVSPARPELLERRPGWSSTWPGAAILRLEPLAPETSGQLIDQLSGGRELPDLLRTRILDVAEGNPLFVEEMVAMLLEDGGVAEADPDSVAVPPTISALLAARLDGLQPGERSLAERASVVGQSFEQAALAALLPREAGGHLVRDLLALVRKDLIRPDRSILTAGDAYRFRHLLIRDAAYAALPKADRAELHQRFGDWLERVSGDRLDEFDEIIGYHFERALGYQRELGSSANPPILVNLGLSAAEHLGKAAYRSLDRSDLPAAARLLNRALKLIPRDDARRAEWTADLVDAHIQLGDMQAAAALVEDLENQSQTDQTARAWYLVSMLESSLYLGTYSAVESEGLAEEALRSFAALDHHRGLARTFLARAHADWYQLHGGASVRWLTRAADHARRAARRSDELGVLVWLIRALAWGPTPVTHALRELDSLDSDLGGDRRIEASVARTRAMLIAMHGGHAEARALHERSITLFGELGMALDLGEAAQSGYYVAMWGGDPKTARRWLEESCDLLARRGERTLFSTNAAMLARALLDQGNRDAAAEWLERAFETASADDRVTQAQARSLAARVSAESGDEAEANRLVAEALMLIGDSAGTDFWNDAEVMSDAAYVHQAFGGREEAVALLEQARERHVNKESLVEAESLENRIAQLRAGQPEESPGRSQR